MPSVPSRPRAVRPKRVGPGRAWDDQRRAQKRFYYEPHRPGPASMHPRPSEEERAGRGKMKGSTHRGYFHGLSGLSARNSRQTPFLRPAPGAIAYIGCQVGRLSCRKTIGKRAKPGSFVTNRARRRPKNTSVCRVARKTNAHRRTPALMLGRSHPGLQLIRGSRPRLPEMRRWKSWPGPARSAAGRCGAGSALERHPRPAPPR